MNYFELFHLPISLDVDIARARKTFYELSRIHHPDRFGNESEEKQQEVLQYAAEINKAWKILSNRDETLKYFLQLKGMLEEGDKYNLPSDFLMDMMELNEALSDAKFENNAEAINESEKAINAQKELLEESFQQYLSTLDLTTANTASLAPIKEYYFKKKYLQRILEGLNG